MLAGASGPHPPVSTTVSTGVDSTLTSVPGTAGAGGEGSRAQKIPCEGLGESPGPVAVGAAVTHERLRTIHRPPGGRNRCGSTRTGAHGDRRRRSPEPDRRKFAAWALRARSRRSVLGEPGARPGFDRGRVPRAGRPPALGGVRGGGPRTAGARRCAGSPGAHARRRTCCCPRGCAGTLPATSSHRRALVVPHGLLDLASSDPGLQPRAACCHSPLRGRAVP
jgi:hypothetical protein